MLKTKNLTEEWNVVQRAGERTLTPAFESEEHRLRQFVAMYAIGCTLGSNTWIWDVQKRRVVTVLQLVGQHASQNSGGLQCCCTCVALEQALMALAAYGMPLEASGCQHIIGASHTGHAEDDLAGAVHQVGLPVSFIHRTSKWPDDPLCSLKCVAEFRSGMERFGLRELACAEIGERSNACI